MTDFTPAPKLTGLAYIPRWLGGVACYIVFGLGGLLSSLTLLPLIKCWPGSREQKIKRVRKAVHIMFRGVVAMLTWAGVIKVSTENAALLRSIKGKIIIANHPTLVDVVVMISFIPNAGCIVKQALWRNPFLRGVVSCAGYIPNRGADLLLADCKSELATGTNLIIFPEGTRTQIGATINQFTRGAANITLRTQNELIPIVLRTNAIGLSKQQPWYHIPARTIGMRVEIGHPLSYSDYSSASSVDMNMSLDAKKARQMTRDLEIYYKQQLDMTHEIT
ncbi:lysophospholipid acyltransferase family protein [Shewanella surugensis]|uniref:1-acyl-sn-glycerol-3-phosphate acyltransferase n=1 Tax=Shewanella surugensis TaxID=212020 RepID=A0ABT0LAU2_9GAMM|nr:lysophospholipid acyltransferase family protein [Shewanella surugensis]MCL1124605.1 1-acyl-sn-glycerol-3-phosphate acyltransferase [Shewanella surugensis]